MILAMDIGNTNIKTGVFDASTLRSYWRISTQRQYTSDEFGSLLLNLFAHEKLDPETIEGIIISSVVPTINFTVEHMCRSYFDLQPMFIAPGVKTGINIRYENPRELGSDRIANAVSAFTQYGGPVITIDFGTATTFGVVDENAAFLGGAIFPGIKLASQALSSGTAKLPSFEIAQPDRVIGRTTLSNLQSGMFYGYVGMVGHIVEMMKRELGKDATVVATGGMAQMIADESHVIDHVDGLLTLKGLRFIWEKNQDA